MTTYMCIQEREGGRDERKKGAERREREGARETYVCTLQKHEQCEHVERLNRNKTFCLDINISIQ